MENVSVQWFPGHMAKTRRLMKANLPLVDLVVELTDARIPASSRNPELGSLIGKKPRLVLLNKSDAADEKVTAAWLQEYRGKGIWALAADCRSGRGLQKFLPMVRQVLAKELERRRDRGMAGRPIRMMVVGIPNVGKSSFINRMAGQKRAKVEDRPGVTRGKQWVTLGSGMDLLDMPGVLWPKFEDRQVGEKLAFTGAVKDDILDTQALAGRLLETLVQLGYAPLLQSRYKLVPEQMDGLDGLALLELIARRRGMLLAGAQVDLERASIMVLDEFRSGAMGRISLEMPGAR